MIIDFLPIALFLVISFVTTFLATPILIDSATRKKIFGIDDNKPRRPLVPYSGGFAIYAGIAGGILVAILYSVFLKNDPSELNLMLAALASITMLSLIGIFDDFFKLSWKTKALIPVLGALPLVAITAGSTSLGIPFFGEVDLGLLYTFVLLPLGVTGAANAVNMVAGYNGVEAGTVGVISAFLLFIAVQTGSFPASVILAVTLGACVAFLWFNWFPSKVFPGDVGTLALGAAIASAVIAGNMERYGVILFIPAFYELGATLYYWLKGVERREACHNPLIDREGRLTPPRGTGNYTVFYKLLSWKPMREDSLVKTVMLLYCASGLLALFVFFLHA